MSKKKNDKRLKRAKEKAKQSRIQRNEVKRPKFLKMKKPLMRVIDPPEDFILAKVVK